MASIKPSKKFEAALHAAETDPGIPKDEAKAQIEELRSDLLRAQYARLAHPKHALLVVIAGIDGSGKGRCISVLNEWMDARHIDTLAFGEPGPKEQGKPFLWRYWQYMPAKGRSAIVFGSWYRPLFQELAEKDPDPEKIYDIAHTIRDFERTLADNGVQVLKLWYHLSKDAQEKRTEKLLKDPDTAWQVNPDDLKVSKKFGKAREAGLLAMSLTHEAHAPWVVIPSADDHVRAICTGQAVLKALRKRVIHHHELLDSTPVDAPEKIVITPPDSVPDPDDDDTTPDLPRKPLRPMAPAISLDRLDYTLALKKSDYEDQLVALQGRLARLTRHKRFTELPVVLVFEGQDAAGKGSTIRRITHALDARMFRAIPIAAPTDEEKARPYLWRFWRRLPAPGRIAIFDRSWYGRVLVERVEGFAAPAEWQRAYEEINQFEEEIVAGGAVLLKFWLAVTKDEQLKRFEDRQKSAFKNFKITDEDWRNREKWDSYVQATNDMFQRTSTALCPWHAFPANDKLYARVQVLNTIVTQLEQALGVEA